MNKRDFLKVGLAGMGAMLLGSRARALEFFPTPSPHRWAVIFGTWCGTSRDAAVWISEGMDGIASVFDVREQPDPARFEHLVIGGSIRSGQIPPLLQEFIASHRSTMQRKLRGLFAVCGNMQQPITPKQEADFIHNHLALLTGAQGVPYRVFLGRITLGLLEPQVQQMMRAIPGVQDYDNLKRPDCMAFGREVFQAVQA